MALHYPPYAYYPDVDDLALNVEPSERVGAPLPHPYKGIVGRLSLLVAILGAAWIVVTDKGEPDSWVSYARSFADEASVELQKIAARPNAEIARDTAALAGGPSMPQSAGEIAPLPLLPPVPAEAPAPAASEPSASEPTATEDLGSAYSAAEPEQKPEQKRAVAAGLGPDLPNVLLSRLTKTDLKNAAYAIDTAIAKTPDDGVFSWPQSPSRKQALFEVRFVEGAADGCRRYVVTVTKQRWSSTTAALEKCGGAGGQSG